MVEPMGENLDAVERDQAHRETSDLAKDTICSDRPKDNNQKEGDADGELEQRVERHWIIKIRVSEVSASRLTEQARSPWLDGCVVAHM